MADVLFVHGLKSGKSSTKYEALAEFDRDCIEFDYPRSCPFEVSGALFDHALTTDVKVIVGHSLGGGLALSLSAKLQIPCVVVNPSFHAMTVANGFTRESYNEWQKVIWYFNQGRQYPFGIGLIELGDEIVDQKRNLSTLANYLDLMVWHGGYHRFSRLQKLKDSVSYLLNTPLSRTDGC